jgi:DNA (cytosine-5)-methyltransferase 1
MKYKLGSFFAGIGGIDKGFAQAGFDPIWANDIDKYCKLTYELNNKAEFVLEDINKIKGTDMPKIDVLAGGFPCQPFSVAGHRKGFDDDRGGLFFQITRIIQELEEQPKIVFLENVKNLFTHDKGETYRRIKTELKSLGYIVFEKILNTSEYGNLPQNRERLFIVAILNKKVASKFKWPEKTKLTNTLNKIIDWDMQVSSKYYYDKNSKIYDLLNESVKKTNTIYQYRRVYVRENKSGMCPTLTANMGMGGHNVPIILDNYNRIRKLTPRECLKLQGFDESFNIPEKTADSRIYKQVGNSVSVSLIKKIADSIMRALLVMEE